MKPALPIVWSIAGHDTSGGAGLSADQRAADAMGVHLCPVVAAITAQHSQDVDAVFPVDASTLDAQLATLADDLPPAAIKTGLLGSVAAIGVLVRWIDRLRQSNPSLPLVIDPVLGASSGGAAFCDDAVLAAYRRELLPRATLITPNRAEARRLLGRAATHQGPSEELPSLAAELRALGVAHVVITGGDAPPTDGLVPAQAWVLDWMDTSQAQGWLVGPRVDTPHTHGTGCTFASGAAAAMAWGHVAADAVVLAKMLTHQALQQGHPAGQGAGPVIATNAPGLGPLPWLGQGRELPWQVTHGDGSGAPLFQRFEPPADGLYGILPDSAMVTAAAQAGLRCLQLRHKARDGAQAHIEASARHCAESGAALFINDHWPQALALPRPPGPRQGSPLGLHLGQEDLLALDTDARQQLLAARHHVMLGLSSHSVWELARAAGCGASLIACGPVQATTTKDMPWLPQGEDNLRWWVAHSPAPVVAIGGLLAPADLTRFAACQPAALCVVRGLGEEPEGIAARLPALRQAVAQGRALSPIAAPFLPHPVL